MKRKIKFSIVIALAPWREAEIVDCLKNQDFPKKEFEVIVEKGLNVPTNRNNGVKKSKGEIILFLDDDAHIEKDFLKNVDEFFTKYPQTDILGGPQLTPSSDNLFARTNGHVLGSVLASVKASNRYKRRKLTLNANSSYITGALMICRRKVFDSLDFDPKVYPGDDIYFVDRAKKMGLKIAYSPDVFIYHKRRSNINGFVKQIFDYARLRSNNKGRNYLFQVPSLFVIYVLLLPMLYFINILFIAPLILYYALVIIFSVYESILQKDLLTMPIMPFIFMIVHLTYGLGFIFGIFENIGKNG